MYVVFACIDKWYKLNMHCQYLVSTVHLTYSNNCNGSWQNNYWEWSI